MYVYADLTYSSRLLPHHENGDAGLTSRFHKKWNIRASAARPATPKDPTTDIDFGDSKDTALSTTSSTSSATSSACITSLDLLCVAAALVHEQTAYQACQTEDADSGGRLLGFLCCMDGCGSLMLSIALSFRKTARSDCFKVAPYESPPAAHYPTRHRTWSNHVRRKRKTAIEDSELLRRHFFHSSVHDCSKENVNC
ncbi:uncharacterized protein LOC142776646 isoform X1 [Rhipicephalus microplus]|uniref:uncharacterized protein LOC142776646 isoform X1 n=1 Tax=Rhipicephalus microplus TaxID=6941 RepID=UPI003F6D37FA